MNKFRSTSETDSNFLYYGFDAGKKLYTIGGDAVEIVTTNGPGPAPIIGLIDAINSQAGVLHRWNVLGSSYDGCIREIPRRRDLKPNCEPVIPAFDWNRPFKTRCGHRVRIVERHRIGARPILALVLVPGRPREMPQLYYMNGKVKPNNQPHPYDLAND